MALGIGAALAASATAALLPKLFDWMSGGNKQEMPKQAGQAVPDTKPPLQVPQAPATQFVPPQMGGGGRRPPSSGASESDILSQALTKWMGR